MTSGLKNLTFCCDNFQSGIQLHGARQSMGHKLDKSRKGIKYI